MDTENQKYEGHGNTWSAVAGKDFDVAALAKKVVETTKESDVRNKNDFAGIISFDAPIRALALIHIDPKKEHSELYSLYPFLQISNPLAIEVDKIDEWSNGVEAVIEGSINGIKISFFEPLYFLNKGRYEVGKNYLFHLGAIAHLFAKRTKDLVIEPTEGPLKGEKLYTQKMTSFMTVENYGGEATFICPFTSFNGQTEAFGKSFKIFPYHLMSGDMDQAAFNFPMFVRTDLIEGELVAGDSMQGTAWLQGYLIDSLEEDNQKK